MHRVNGYLLLLLLGLSHSVGAQTRNTLCGFLGPTAPQTSQPSTPAIGKQEPRYAGACVIQVFRCPLGSKHSDKWAIAPLSANNLPIPGVAGTLPAGAGDWNLYFSYDTTTSKLSLNGAPQIPDPMEAMNICGGKSPSGKLGAVPADWLLVPASSAVPAPTAITPYLIITGLSIPASGIKFADKDSCQGLLTMPLSLAHLVAPSQTMVIATSESLPSPPHSGSASPASTGLNGFRINHRDAGGKYDADTAQLLRAFTGYYLNKRIPSLFWNYRDPVHCPPPTTP